MDFLFLQFYIKKKYDLSLDKYFSIGKQSISDWRISNICKCDEILFAHR